ncbi:GTP pyrophosphokinase family protein [Turicibacter sanguinis]|uniref:GTP pyrophosphokinase n=1 Tax=Turicibacter sanguinis TaxID=154288 RepID=UPI0006C49069|nr:(p)ppGpp synthetase [Turicibacter sanguinis]KAB3583824.1 (p)ppGpp synthetase [Phocaeicola vulgatus]MCU7212407.1 (p)ppGpp synthetase [Turicibacter sanguinis]MDB8564198.1 (p)ppGpp synthetase [Turicibacter sanguinis]MDB8574532.1 (p)ppGpp synthetase [Turicibacter sanguinis]MDB8577589.1 (p)ppGpp synthetase [Turicibacter sanguinis]
MPLAEFKYIEKALATLDKKSEQLQIISTLLQIEFEQIVNLYDIEYLNITSRVKSHDSLKEKILRQGYYKKYNDPIRLIYHLSDLIGVRIECRFEQDEREIYKILRKHFNIRNEEGYYYNDMNPNVKLSLDGRQPQKQKNGFKIYRIDGIITDTNTDLPFELQIKSLVNTFWGEIEHKIIYKNYSYLLVDDLLKEMMHSIKNNLALLDKQLLTIYRNVEQNQTDEDYQRKGFEDMLAKMCNDVFAKKIKASIGMNVNIKKACQTIMKYTFSPTVGFELNQNTATLIKALERLSEISKQTVHFNVPIKFERDPIYTTQFQKIVGPYFIDVMNKEFHWNLFFIMLFEIEPQDNVGDFEKFIGFLEQAYQSSPSVTRLKKVLYSQLEEHSDDIMEQIMVTLANSIIATDDIECIYEDSISDVTSVMIDVLRDITSQITTIDQWRDQQDVLLTELSDRFNEALE